MTPCARRGAIQAECQIGRQGRFCFRTLSSGIFLARTEIRVDCCFREAVDCHEITNQGALSRFFAELRDLVNCERGPLSELYTLIVTRPRSVNSTVFPARFEEMEEPRRAAKAICPPEEILLPVPGAVISGAREWTSIALHGQGKLDLPRRFPPFEEGAPRHDPSGACSQSWIWSSFNSVS